LENKKMAEIKITIDSIMGGMSPMATATGKGQFMHSVAIDPESSLLKKPRGILYPVGYENFSSTKVSGAPMWIMTSPANDKVYVYCDDGELLSYTSGLATETEAVAAGTMAAGGNGAAYYNDYIYMCEPTKVWRYGPITAGSPAISNSLIANGELLDGWNDGTDTALTNTSYQGIRSVTYPNHAMHVHTDGALYLCDFASGIGMIHKIKTTYAGVNDGSQYNVLDLPFDVKPYDIESYGNDLAIIGTKHGSDTLISQGKSYLFLWDTISDSFYREVQIPAGFVSAVVNVRGQLYIWGGTVGFGWQLYRYNGGYDIELLWDSYDGSTPFAGAVDTYGDRVVWGAYITSPSELAEVLAYGYQNSQLGKSAVHSIGVFPSTQTLPVISALKFVQSQSQSIKRPLIGGRTTTTATYTLAQLKTDVAKSSKFISSLYHIGRPFRLKQLSFSLTSVVASGVTIVPSILFDNSSTKTLATINNTNYPGEKDIKYKAMEIDAASVSDYQPKQDFYLQFDITGTSDIGIELPIEIILETRDD
jgi:hypothetical protein